MLMTSIEINFPALAKDYVLNETTEEMSKALLLYPGIANNTISYGRVAELLGMHKIDLIKLYSRLRIQYLDMTDEEFGEEIQTVKRLAGTKV